MICAMSNSAPMNIQDWIRSILDRKPDKTQAGLAKALGRDPSAITRLLQGGRQVKADELGIIATYLGEAPPDSAYFASSGGRGHPPTSQLPLPEEASLSSGMIELDGEEYASIPRFDAALSAGPGSIIDGEEPEGFTLFENQWLRAITTVAPSRLAVVRVDGDSMEDTLRDRDLVLIDRSQHRFDRQGIYALRVGEVCWVKRLSLDLREHLIRIISDNPKYPEEKLPEEEVALLGRVVFIVGRRL